MSGSASTGVLSRTVQPKAMPVDLSNLALMDKNGKATRVGFRMEGDKKVRFAKTTGEAI